jgi:hypothetical protein
MKTPPRPNDIDYGPLPVEEEIVILRPSWILAFDAWLLALIGGALLLAFVPQLLMLGEILLGPQPWLNALAGWFWVPALLPFFWAVWRHLELRCTSWTITSQRLIHRTGVLSVMQEELELVRIRDFQVRKPLWLRMMGLGNLIVISRDPVTPTMTIDAQPRIEALRDLLRHQVLKRQVELGYREFDSGAISI